VEGWVIAPFGVLALMFLLFRVWLCLRGAGGEPNVRSSGPVVYCAQCSAQFGGPNRMLEYTEHRMSHEKDV